MLLIKVIHSNHFRNLQTTQNYFELLTGKHTQNQNPFKNKLLATNYKDTQTTIDIKTLLQHNFQKTQSVNTEKVIPTRNKRKQQSQTKTNSTLCHCDRQPTIMTE